MSLLDHYAQQLDALEAKGNLRSFQSNIQQDRYITLNNSKMLNLSSNDYLGLATDLNLREQFFDEVPNELRLMSSSSSRLLTGHFPVYEQLENTLSHLFLGRSALIFNSGYHMNIGIIPAISDGATLILADKLVHASLIDGIRLSSAKYVRYRHNDLDHLQQLIEKYHDEKNIDRIIVVTESIFSMDGDEIDLTTLVRVKKQFNKVMLYVDEAHAIGVRGERGLGCAEQYKVLEEIDFLVGTFGKSIASVGGYLICHSIIRNYLINTMRPLIFSTAQPPICFAWTNFILEKMVSMQLKRQHISSISNCLKNMLLSKGYASTSTSHIVPIVIGESQEAVNKAQFLQEHGFYVLPVRPPTVPQNTSRLRVCLTAKIQHDDVEKLAALL